MEEFLRQVMEQVERGINIEERNIDGPVIFEVSIAKTVKTGGGLKFYVFNGGYGKEKEHVAKMTLKAYPKESERSKRWSEEVNRMNKENGEKWKS